MNISEIKKQFGVLITGAFAFIAALVWRDAIMAWMEPFLVGNGATALTVVALVVTIIAIIATWFVGKMLQ